MDDKEENNGPQTNENDKTKKAGMTQNGKAENRGEQGHNSI